MDAFDKRAIETQREAAKISKQQAPIAIEEDLFDQRAKQLHNTSLLEDIARGFKRSSLAAPVVAAPEEEADTFGGRLAESVGELAGDIPAMSLGGSGGALAGAAAGSLLGPVGTAVGALLGGGAGAFAAPTAVKSTAREIRKGTDPLKAVGNIAYDVGKSGLVGAATGAAGRLAGPALSRFGGKAGERVLSSALGRGAVETAGELAGMTGAQYQLGDEITPEGLAQNALLVGGMKGAGTLAGKLPLKKPEVTYNVEDILKKPSSKKKEAFSLVREHLGERAAKTYLSHMKWQEELAEYEKEHGKATAENLEDMIYYSQKTGNPNKIIKPEIKKLEGESDASFKKRKAKQSEVDSQLDAFVAKRIEGESEAEYQEHLKWLKEVEEEEIKAAYRSDEGEEPVSRKKGFKEKKVEIISESFDQLKERLPKHAQDFVDNIIRPHLDKSLKEWNENPYTKDIKPREGLEDTYLPGLYEGTQEQFDRAAAQVSKRFKTKNPFANQKTFLSYNEAFKEAGLKPRFTNIVDLLKHYDKVMIKSAANSEFASKLKDVKVNNKSIIVRPMNSDAYNKAKQSGFVEFNDPFLKRYVAGTGKDGKLIWATSEKPVLIHPDFAPALQGVFSKDAYKPEAQAWKYYDAVNDTMKRMAVHIPLLNKLPGALSIMAAPFHTVALSEHAWSDMGTKTIEGIRTGEQLLKNKEAVSDALRHGVTLERGDVEGREKNYLFGKLQPSMKMGSYNLFTQDAINKLSKKGTPPDAEGIKAIKQAAADYVNNLYGGQNWELLNWFNDKNNLKAARRTAGYLDWSVSALRNAGQFFKTGYTGERARKMWARYGLTLLGTRAVIDAFNRSLVQTDQENKSPLGIRLNPEKFWENLNLFGKAGERVVFALPDVPVNIPLIGEWNPGRDRENHRRFGHFGKSVYEVFHYGTKLWPQLFSKSAPLLQQAYKQVTGSTPSEWGPFVVQPKYVGGKPVPWEGKEGYDQFLARSKELALSFVPFSLRGANVKAGSVGEDLGDISSKYFASAGGAFPISKGLTPFKAKPLIKDLLKKNDVKGINEVRDILVENGYSYEKANKAIQEVKTEIRKAKEGK